MVKVKKGKGIPKEVLDQLDIRRKEKEELEVTPLIENHQVRLPIPHKIRLELNLKKSKKCKVRYDRENKELIYKFK